MGGLEPRRRRAPPVDLGAAGAPDGDGGIYFGVFTAPEAAAGSLHALPVAAAMYGKFGLRDLRACAVATMRTSMMVFMIIAGAMMLGHAMTLIRL
jgi:C4-dicarboxylate transporter DctM subunit